MKRIIALCLSLIIVSGIVCGCAPAPAPSSSDTVTVTDHNGNTVTLPADIERIAVCDIFPLPSVLAVFFRSADKIVAMSTSSMSAAKNGLLGELFPEILKADTGAISGADVNLEELMKVDPQVVFYSAANPRLGESLTKAGFNAVAVSADKWESNPLETLDQWIILLSQIFPEAAGDRAALVKQYGEEALALVKERTEKLTEAEKARIFILFQYSEDSILTSGAKFFGEWWANAIGAVNVGGEMKDAKSAKVTMEQIYAWNPQQILITNFTPAGPDDLKNNTVGNYDWSGIAAVQTGKVYKMPLGMYRSYTTGVDAPVTLLWLAKTVYPDLFADLDIRQKTVEYYRDIFGIELTAAQADRIFSPAGEAGKTELIG